MTALTTNAAGVALIKKYEGVVLVATQDPGGIWTIGYGHTVGVSFGQQITQAEADQLLAQDLAIFETGVAAVAKSPSSNEFSAMVSLAYNIGLGAFGNSSVLRDHNAGDKVEASSAFLLWDKAHVDGELVVLPGLVERRAAEKALYLSADAPPIPQPDPGTTIKAIEDQLAVVMADVVKLSQIVTSAGTAFPPPLSQGHSE